MMYIFRFCPDCGEPLPHPDDPPERVVAQQCTGCGAVHFRNAKPSAGAVIVRDGKVLLGRRAHEPARGHWDIPGGFLDPWEHPAAGAVREVGEETGLVVALKGVLDLIIDTYLGRHYVLTIYYLAEVIGGQERAGDDLGELRWCGPDELPDTFAFDNCRQALEAWRRTLRQE